MKEENRKRASLVTLGKKTTRRERLKKTERERSGAWFSQTSTTEIAQDVSPSCCNCAGSATSFWEGKNLGEWTLKASLKRVGRDCRGANQSIDDYGVGGGGGEIGGQAGVRSNEKDPWRPEEP